MRHTTVLPLLMAALMGAATNTWSLEIGPARSHAVMGERLQLEIPLRLAPGERLQPHCVTADVLVGERLLSGAEVPVRLSPTSASRTWVAEIRTRDPITEPMLEVTISAGCQQRAWQKMTVLVSPPGATSVPLVQHVSEQWEASSRFPSAKHTLPVPTAADLPPTAAGLSLNPGASLKLDAEPTLWSGLAELPSMSSAQRAALEQAISVLRQTNEKARAELQDLEARWAAAQTDKEWLLGLSAAVLLFVAIAVRSLWRTRQVGLASAPMRVPPPESSSPDRKDDFYFALGQAHAGGGGAITGLPAWQAPAKPSGRPNPTPAVERWYGRT